MTSHVLATAAATATARASGPQRARRDARIGTLVGDYLIVERIGAGGMAVVYRAFDRGGCEVALKIPTPLAASDPELLERFVIEGRALELMRHPGVVHLYQIALDDEGKPFHVLEYLRGRTLSRLLDGGPLPTARACRLVAELAHTVDALHAGGIVHRDLKPSNVFVTTSGRTKVLDFGIAHVAGIGELTQIGFAIGTPGYMSPEQAAGEPCDWRADIYALGVMLRELVTGDRPRLPHATLRGMTPPPSPARTHVPRQLAAIIATATARNRSERWQSARALADALTHIGEHSERSPPSEPTTRRSAVRVKSDDATRCDGPQLGTEVGDFVIAQTVPQLVVHHRGTGERFIVERLIAVDDQHALRIRTDCAALGALASPTISAPFELSSEGRWLYLAEPETCALALPGTPHQIATILAQVAGALAAAHAIGVFHSDLTLDRLRVDHRNHVRITGFRIGDPAGRASIDLRAFARLAAQLLPTTREVERALDAAWGPADGAAMRHVADELRTLARTLRSR